jgi:CarD family transcriptional regulator
VVEKAKKSAAQTEAFRKGAWVVYPAHGVGKVLGAETRRVSGHTLQLIVIYFEKDRMTLRVPVDKAKYSGLRRLSSSSVMAEALETLKGRAKTSRVIWARRAMEFNAKINSGNPVSIAEVVRDLHVNADLENRSYSERQIYESALDRLVRELAAIEGISEETANKRVLKAIAAKNTAVVEMPISAKMPVPAPDLPAALPTALLPAA